MQSVTTTLVLAAEGGHENPLIPATAELIWGAFAFIVFAIIMMKVVFPRLNKTLAERTANIEGKMNSAEAERAQAAELLRQYQAKLEEANLEAARIVEQARTNADRLENELRAQAEEQAHRIVERANEQIIAERDRALASLQSEIGSLAIDLAQRIIGDSLDRERQLKLVDQYISELQKS